MATDMPEDEDALDDEDGEYYRYRDWRRYYLREDVLNLEEFRVALAVRG